MFAWQLELEKALLSAECESESLKLSQDESEKIKAQMRINELEREMAEDNATHSNLQAEAKQRVQRAQQICARLDEQLHSCVDETTQQDIADKLAAQQDVLESERKSFEDLEFHHLEEEASKLATREELQKYAISALIHFKDQLLIDLLYFPNSRTISFEFDFTSDVPYIRLIFHRYLSELTNKIEGRKLQMSHLESQRSDAKNTATKEARCLERQKLGHLKRLEEVSRIILLCKH